MDSNKKEEVKSVKEILEQANKGLDNTLSFLYNGKIDPAKANLEEVSNDLISLSNSDLKLTPYELKLTQDYSRRRNEYVAWVKLIESKNQNVR